MPPAGRSYPLILLPVALYLLLGRHDVLSIPHRWRFKHAGDQVGRLEVTDPLYERLQSTFERETTNERVVDAVLLVAA